MNEVSFIALPLVLLLDRLHANVCEVELLAWAVLLKAVIGINIRESAYPERNL